MSQPCVHQAGKTNHQAIYHVRYNSHLVNFVIFSQVPGRQRIYLFAMLDYYTTIIVQVYESSVHYLV